MIRSFAFESIVYKSVLLIITSYDFSSPRRRGA